MSIFPTFTLLGRIFPHEKCQNVLHINHTNVKINGESNKIVIMLHQLLQ